MDDHEAVEAAYRATRAILRARTITAAQNAVLSLAHSLGAAVVPADAAGSDAVPLDLTLDDGPPQLPAAADGYVRELIARYLAPAVSDARMVAQRSLSAEMLVEDATIDPLTRTWNRRSLELALNRARPGDAVALLDLDHFKRVNDTQGHAAGDTVLATFATYLRGAVRDRDIVGRLGGEEFVIVLPETPAAEACEVVRRLQRRWRELGVFPVTFSAGVAPVPEQPTTGETPGQLALLVADTLMYRVKSEGRDRVECALG